MSVTTEDILRAVLIAVVADKNFTEAVMRLRDMGRSSQTTKSRRLNYNEISTCLGQRLKTVVFRSTPEKA